MTGGFDQAAVAALRAAARRNAAVSARRVVSPQHDLAAVTIRDGVSGDDGVRAHVSRGSILHGEVRTVQVATDQHRAGASIAGNINMPAEQADLFAQHLHGPAGPACASTFGLDRAGHQRGAGFGLNRYRAGLLAVGAEAAAGVEGHILFRTQDDFAACVAHHLVGIDDARVPQRRAVYAHSPALRKNLA